MMKVIGVLKGGPLAEENEIKDIPRAQIEDTALIDLINSTERYYSGADVSAAALYTLDANMYPGDIHKCDTALVYKYTNTLYKLKMTGLQLKEYMEWSAKYFNTFKPGDLTISFDENVRAYNFDMFSGVNYEINISKDPGNRIENLTWPDGSPVKDTDEFELAVNDYRANTFLLIPGEIYEEGDCPELVEMDIKSNIGSIRELIGDYIKNVKGGTITPEYDNNWKITGVEWDEELHEEAVEKAAKGEIDIPYSEDGRTPNVKSITAEDLK
jgi:2',3'-cyclic-nucleotide 2'-phosphodiesterase/3'-nucleotidase